MALDLKAKPGHCAECVMGMPFYVPCNKPATCIVYWPGGEECPQCDMCANHSTRNRGAKRKELPKDPCSDHLTE